MRRRIVTAVVLAGIALTALFMSAQAQDRISFGVDAQLVQYSLPESAAVNFDARFTPKAWVSYSAASRTSLVLSYEKGLGSDYPGLAEVGGRLSLGPAGAEDNLRFGVGLDGCHFDNAGALGVREWDYSGSLRASQLIVRGEGGDPIAYVKGFGEYFVLSEKYRVGVALGADF